MVDQPIRQRRRAIRTKLMLDWLNPLEWRKKVEFLPKNRVFQAAQSKEGLQAEGLRGDDLPPESSCDDFCAREQFLKGIRRLHRPSISAGKTVWHPIKHARIYRERPTMNACAYNLLGVRNTSRFPSGRACS